MNIRNQVINAISKLLEDENKKELLDFNNDLSTLGFNSISFIKLVLELEDIFNIEFDDELLSYKKFISLDNLCDYIDIRMQNKK